MNKKLGFIFLAIALWLIFPIPGPDDAISFYAYSIYAGVPFNLDNLSSVYLDYIIFTTIIGIIFLFFAMYHLNWSWKRLFKKLDLGKYKISLILGGSVILLISYFNLKGNIPYFLMGLVALVYYFAIRKDKSETLAVLFTPFILLKFGTVDLLNFIFQRVPIPAVLDINNPVVLWISSTLSFNGVTNISLIISVFIGVILIFLMSKFMKDKI